MEIMLNGKTQQLADGSTAADLVVTLGLTGKRVAMEINQEILPRSQFQTHVLQPGDQVEVVHAIGGGLAKSL
ncbi:MAG: sulfur carrier protein ThiS [Gammaproteobacteria bacterium]|nr:MAG: sulfur carrier protein ThiS [Gammaproteobacteria bacterium]